MRPSQNRIQLWPFAVLAFIVVLLLLSFDRPMRLATNTPLAFRTVAVIGGNKPNPELADEYWQLAVAVVQWKYPFGSALPHDPPAEFALPREARVKQRQDEGARQQYWAALRQLWLRPEVWQRELDFDVSWAGRAGRDLTDFFSGFFSRS